MMSESPKPSCLICNLPALENSEFCSERHKKIHQLDANLRALKAAKDSHTKDIILEKIRTLEDELNLRQIDRLNTADPKVQEKFGL